MNTFIVAGWRWAQTSFFSRSTRACFRLKRLFWAWTHFCVIDKMENWNYRGRFFFRSNVGFSRSLEMIDGMTIWVGDQFSNVMIEANWAFVNILLSANASKLIRKTPIISRLHFWEFSFILMESRPIQFSEPKMLWKLLKVFLRLTCLCKISWHKLAM